MIPRIRIDQAVTLAGPFALGVLPDGSYAPGTHLWRGDVFAQTIAATPVDCRPADEWRGVTVSLINLWSINYFHWVLENLLQLVSLLGQAIDRIVVQRDAPGFVQESLRMLGDQLPAEVVEWQDRSVWCEQLLSFGPVRWDGRTDEAALGKLIAAYPVDGHAPERIYISRARAGSRRVTNEAELIGMLERQGFWVVELEQTSFRCQRELFACANTIVAPHGAGLTNMVWAPCGCRVIELSGSYTNPCYFWLAQALHHSHAEVSCRPDGAHMIADLEAVKGAL